MDKPRDIGEETDRDLSRVSYMVAIESSRAYHDGYRRCLFDVFSVAIIFSFFAAVALFRRGSPE